MAVMNGNLTERLKERILAFEPAPTRVDVGEVETVGDGIAIVKGLEQAMAM